MNTKKKIEVWEFPEDAELVYSRDDIFFLVFPRKAGSTPSIANQIQRLYSKVLNDQNYDPRIFVQGKAVFALKHNAKISYDFNVQPKVYEITYVDPYPIYVSNEAMEEIKNWPHK